MINYEKYFGTPKAAADSIAGANDFEKAWNHWADSDGALLCTITSPRGKNKTERQAETFQVFLEAEAKEEA